MVETQKTLPKGWKWVRLGEVCDEIYRYPTYYNIQYVDLGIPEVRGELILEDGNIDLNKPKWRYISNCTSSNFPRTILNEGDIVISVRGTLGKIGYIEKDLEGANITANLIRLSPKKDVVFPKYLFRYLKSTQFKNNLESIATNTTIQTFTAPDLKKIKIPLASPATQHKIFEILEEADSLRKMRQQADEKMKDLIPSLFVQMFGDPAKNPKEWPVKKLIELCFKPDYGLTASAIKNGSGYRFLRITDIQNGFVNWETVPYCDSADEEKEKYKLQQGDIVIARIGATTGKAFLFCQKYPDVVFASYLMRVRPKQIVIPKYLYHYMNTNYYWDQIGSDKNSRLKQGINIQTLSNLSIPLPPLPLQQEFAKLVEEIEAEKARQVESKKKLDDLFASLMQRAFAGKLVA